MEDNKVHKVIQGMGQLDFLKAKMWREKWWSYQITNHNTGSMKQVE